MSEIEAIKTFFDHLAGSWDDKADDNLDFVRSLLSKAGIAQGMKCLDLACGTGVITGLLATMTGQPVLGMDLSDEMIVQAERKYAGREDIFFLQGDFYHFDGGRYDAIVLYNAYPHFLDPEALSKTFARHLNSNGRFVVLHSFGRDRLRRHHDGLGPRICRDIGSPEEEWGSYAGEFALVLAEEDGNLYLLCGKKKA